MENTLINSIKRDFRVSGSIGTEELYLLLCEKVEFRARELESVILNCAEETIVKLADKYSWIESYEPYMNVLVLERSLTRSRMPKSDVQM